MIILGIESSCDETGIALLHADSEYKLKVLSNQVSSQICLHAPFGGVVPEIASRAHLSTIAPLAEAALLEANLQWQEIDAIAVTQGPGLIGALLVGASYGKGLALSLDVPLIPVDHVEAHVHGALFGIGQNPLSMKDLMAKVFPCLALVVSGGHTNIYYMKSPTQFELLGYSVDDACGECFDKVGKLLNLSYPAGPILEKLALNGHANAWPMPQMLPVRPHSNRDAFRSGDQKEPPQQPILLSYSGLKTFLAQTIGKIENSLGLPKHLPEQTIADLCASFQEEALGQIVRKVKEALKRRPNAKSILVAGGVAANKRFRSMLSDEVAHVTSYFPPPSVCSDNGAMIAAYGFYKWAEEALDQSTAISPAHETIQKYKNHDWECYSRYRF